MRPVVWFRSMAAVLAAVALSAPAWAASPSVQAVWVPRKVHFVYQGFTTYYSCDGLREEIEGMLTKLGARHIKAIADACIRPSGPDLFPGVRVKMQVLVPAGAHVPATSRVAAHWHKVVLTRATANFNEGGKCELIEQFRRVFLPLFEARNINMQATCVPHQITLGTYLSAEVLRPDHPAHPAAHPAQH